MTSCHSRDFQPKLSSIRLPGYTGPENGEYEVLLVPVTDVSKPGNTREYQGSW